MSKLNINDAAHPYRIVAIDILETIQDRVSKTKDIKNELWYELEDYIVKKINKVK
jgi:hypothetical protein